MAGHGPVCGRGASKGEGGLGLTETSVSLPCLSEHVPLGLADDRARIAAPLLSEQEQIRDQVDDLASGTTVLPMSVSAFGMKIGVERSLSEAGSADFRRHGQVLDIAS